MKRNHLLDILRGIFALLVVIMHIDISSGLHDIRLINKSYLFVDFFFVLSAYVLTKSFLNSRKKDFRILIKKRFLRLYPLHLIILFLFIILELFKYLIMEEIFNLNTRAFQDETSLSSLISTLLLTESLGVNSGNVWNAPSWSISAEFYSYIILLSIIQVPKKILKIFLLALVFLSSVFYVSQQSNLDFGFSFGIIRSIYSSMILLLIYLLWPNLNKKIHLITLILSIIYILIFFTIELKSPIFELLIPIPFGLIVTYIGEYKIDTGRIPILSKLGDLSFPIYLTQALVLTTMAGILNVFSLFTPENVFLDYSGRYIIYDRLISMAVIIFVIAAIIFISIPLYNYSEKWRARLQ